MTELFTVRMSRLKIVKRYDMQGRLIETREEKIPEVVHDLPYVAAARYRDIFPDAEVEILPSAAARSDHGSPDRFYHSSATKRVESGSGFKRDKKNAGDKGSTKASRIADEAARATYADAINAGMKEIAR